METLRILPLGPPGAGKGTQSRRMADRYDIPHLATGDILRENKDMDTEHGAPRDYMEAGKLVPEEVMKAVVEEALSDREGFVLDGYPRTIGQAEHLDSVEELDAIIYFDVDTDILIERLTGRRVDPETGENYHIEFDLPDDPEVEARLIQREDDKREVVTTRLEEYRNETKPVIEYYRDHPGFVEIDGEGDPDAVWNRIVDVLDPLAED